MQSATKTVFKQKTCPKCKNNHDNDSLLCSFCRDEAEAALKRRPPIPPNFWVKCLIVREGDTELNLGNIRYIFRRNQLGDSVCEIINQGHYNQILKSGLYEAYVPKEVEIIEEVKTKVDNKPAPFTDEQVITIESLHAIGTKVTEIAKILSEGLDVSIPWQRVMKYIEANIKE